MSPLLYGFSYVSTKLVLDKFKDRVPTDFSAEQYQDRLNEYSQSMGLDNELACQNVFDKYFKNHPKSLADLDVPKVGDISVQSKLEAASKHQDIQSARKDSLSKLNEIFVINQSTEKAAQKYKEEVQAINKAIKDPNQTIDPYALDHHLQDLKQVTQEIIQKQHQAEIERLEKLFSSDEDYKIMFSKAIGVVPTASKIGEIKNAMMEKLKANQQQQTKMALDPLIQSQTKLHNQLQQDKDRINYLGAVYQRDKAMKKLIDDLAETNSNDNRALLEISQEKESEQINAPISAKLKGIKIEDLPLLKTVTGRKIKRDGDTFTIAMPRSPLFDLQDMLNFTYSPGYFSRYSKSMKRDLESLAMAVKAAGNKSIEINVYHGDTKEMMRMARESYEASRVAGFPENEITIKAKGRELKIEELFKDHPSKLQAIKLRVKGLEETKTQVEAQRSKSGQETTRDYKTGIANIRNAAQEKETVEPTNEVVSPDNPNPS